MLLNWKYQHGLEWIFGIAVCFLLKIYQQIRKASYEHIAAYSEAAFLWTSADGMTVGLSNFPYPLSSSKFFTLQSTKLFFSNAPWEIFGIPTFKLELQSGAVCLALIFSAYFSRRNYKHFKQSALITSLFAKCCCLPSKFQLCQSIWFTNRFLLSTGMWVPGHRALSLMKEFPR